MQTFYVNAIWDDEAGVWCSDTNVPGLTIETETLGEFEALIRELVPELLANNAGVHDATVMLDVTAHAERKLELAVA
jgi:hypothetical protein